MPDGKYGEITTEFKDIPKEEPVFLLRAQDKIACIALMEYARAYKDYSGDMDGYARLLRIVSEFDAWPKKKLPD